MKLIDNFISVRNNKQEDKGISAEFIYNYYDSQETQDEDSSFVEDERNVNIKNRFIRIKIPESITRSYTQSLLASFYSREKENFVQDIESISKIKSLNSFYLNFFNKIDQIYPNRRNFINEIDTEEKKKLLSFYSADQTLHDNSIFGVFSSGKRISLFEEEINNANIQSSTREGIIAEKTLEEENDSYEELVKKNIKLKSAMNSQIAGYKNANYFQNLKPLNSVINNFNLAGFSSVNSVKCGFLIEKYKKESDETYTLLSGKFISTSENRESVTIKNEYEDIAVRYGQTYRYVCYEVYLYTVPDYKNRFICNRYLLCDYPHFTKDIECIENEAPKPPVSLMFKRLSRKSLRITWQEPSDYQYDIKGFQILKRSFLSRPFRIIGQLEGHLLTDYYFPEETTPESLITSTPGEINFEFIDNDYKEGKIQIYTIRSIDAHGMFSDYSEQVAILYDPFEQKVITDYISPLGASVFRPNELLNNKSLFFENKANIVDNLPSAKNPEKFTLYVTPDFQKIKIGESEIKNLIDENAGFYKFSVLKINNLSKYETTLKIENFNT